MFGAEPQEQWTDEEKKDFEEHASIRLQLCISSAIKVGGALLLNVLIVIPFVAGHSLHRHWYQARFLIITALGLFLWFVYKAGLIWASWQSSREVRLEYKQLG